jgi:hypothetical protein
MSEIKSTQPLIVPSPHMEELPPVRQVWRAASSSRAGMFHYTFLYEDNKVDCTCEGWKMAGKCWHTTEVMESNDLDPEFSVSIDPE